MGNLFRGKTVLVTGGASGIGRHTAVSFAREGANVAIVTGRSIDAAEDTVAEIEKLGVKAVFARCDVSNESQVEAAVDKTVAAFGSLDIAFNNAGVGPDGMTIPFAPLIDVTESDWDLVVDTDLKGVFLCMKHELRQMRKQGSGCIVNTSSTASLKMMASFGAYCPAKAAINAVSKCAAIENRDRGIRVNVVCPGPTGGTGMSDRMLGGARKPAPGAPAFPPLPDGVRMGVPDDIARVVLWLCSDAASHVNGNIVCADGGMDIA